MKTETIKIIKRYLLPLLAINFTLQACVEKKPENKKERFYKNFSIEKQVGMEEIRAKDIQVHKNLGNSFVKISFTNDTPQKIKVSNVKSKQYDIGLDYSNRRVLLTVNSIDNYANNPSYLIYNKKKNGFTSFYFPDNVPLVDSSFECVIHEFDHNTSVVYEAKLKAHDTLNFKRKLLDGWEVNDSLRKNHKRNKISFNGSLIDFLN